MSNEHQKESKLLLAILCELQGKILLFNSFRGEIVRRPEKKCTTAIIKRKFEGKIVDLFGNWGFFIFDLLTLEGSNLMHQNKSTQTVFYYFWRKMNV